MHAVRNSWYDISQATFCLWFYPNRKILIILMTSQQWWLFECWYETICPTPTTWGNTFLWMHQTGTRKNPCYLFVFITTSSRNQYLMSYCFSSLTLKELLLCLFDYWDLHYCLLYFDWFLSDDKDILRTK